MSENSRLSFHSRVVAPDQPYVNWERKLIKLFSLSLLSFTLLSLQPLHFSSRFLNFALSNVCNSLTL